MTRWVLWLLAVLPAAAADFTAQLWADIAPVYAETLKHPFLTGLTDGTLPRDRFQFYLVQDGQYLRAFGQALNRLAAKAPREEWSLTLAQHAIDAIRAERELHEKILASYGVDRAAVQRAEMAPTNYAYTNHLLQAVEHSTFAEGLAALLPCYWIYWEVGKELVKRGSSEPPYQKWIDQYAGDEYAKSVRQVLAMMNAEAEGASERVRQSARRLFLLSARYEYLFWDMAWKLEKWPPASK
ncbi:MAG: thiaminase II [Bryobacteraceae bacterium]|nr:thiaminase II [Bryobacteraceae bacterium]